MKEGLVHSCSRFGAITLFCTVYVKFYQMERFVGLFIRDTTLSICLNKTMSMKKVCYFPDMLLYRHPFWNVTIKLVVLPVQTLCVFYGFCKMFVSLSAIL